MNNKVQSKINLFENHIDKGQVKTTKGVNRPSSLWNKTCSDLWKIHKPNMTYRQFLQSNELKEEYIKRKSEL